VSVVPILGPRNAERYPTYRRLDLRLTRRVSRRPGRSLRFYFEVTNLLDHDNVRALSDFNFFPQGDGTVQVEGERENWLPLLPSFGITWEL
jgi:hypothetical protein